MIIIIIIIIIITIMISQNKLRDLEAEMLKMVCKDAQIEPVLQEVNGEVLTPGTNRAADARLHILGAARLCLFYVRVCYRMQSLTEVSPKHKSTASMRVRRRECTPSGCLKSNKAPLLHWYLLPLEEWEMNARGITVDWLNFYQPRRENITELQYHALPRSALLGLRGSRCTRRAPLNITLNPNPKPYR